MLENLLEEAPLVLRMTGALQVAGLEAAVRNMMGGKPDPNDGDGKRVPPDRLYSADELLNRYAQDPETLANLAAWTPAAARDALAHTRHAPGWALALIDFTAARAIG